MENLWYPAVILCLPGGRRGDRCCLFQPNLASAFIEMEYWHVAWATLIGAKKAPASLVGWLLSSLLWYFWSKFNCCGDRYGVKILNTLDKLPVKF